MVANRYWFVVARWVLTSIVTAIVAGWLRDTVESRPRMRQPGQREKDLPLWAAQHSRLMRCWPFTAIYRRIALMACRRLSQTEDRSDQPVRVLAVGYGLGPLANAITRLRSHVLVIGLASSRVAREQDRRQPVNDRALLIQGDGTALPFRDNTIDLIISTFALHHWSNGEGVLSEIGRVLHSIAGQVLLVDLRRDLSLPLWIIVRLATLLLSVTRQSLSKELADSVTASYTPAEAEWLAGRAGLRGVFGRGNAVALWLEGTCKRPESMRKRSGSR